MTALGVEFGLGIAKGCKEIGRDLIVFKGE